MLDLAEARLQEQCDFGVPGEEHTIGGEQAAQYRDYLLARLLVQIDQQIPAIDRVIRQGRCEALKQIRLPEADLGGDLVMQAVNLLDGVEVLLDQPRHGMAERRFAVDGAARHRDRMGADIHRIDGELARRQACFEQRNRDGIWFFAGGAWDGEHAQRPRAAGGEPGQAHERLSVPEEPGFRYCQDFRRLLERGGARQVHTSDCLAAQLVKHQAGVAREFFVGVHHAPSPGKSISRSAGGSSPATVIFWIVPARSTSTGPR